MLNCEPSFSQAQRNVGLVVWVVGEENSWARNWIMIHISLIIPRLCFPALCSLPCRGQTKNGSKKWCSCHLYWLLHHHLPGYTHLYNTSSKEKRENLKSSRGSIKRRCSHFQYEFPEFFTKILFTHLESVSFFISFLPPDIPFPSSSFPLTHQTISQLRPSSCVFVCVSLFSHRAPKRRRSKRGKRETGNELSGQRSPVYCATGIANKELRVLAISLAMTFWAKSNQNSLINNPYSTMSDLFRLLSLVCCLHRSVYCCICSDSQNANGNNLSADQV